MSIYSFITRFLLTTNYWLECWSIFTGSLVEDIQVTLEEDISTWRVRWLVDMCDFKYILVHQEHKTKTKVNIKLFVILIATW